MNADLWYMLTAFLFPAVATLTAVYVTLAWAHRYWQYRQELKANQRSKRPPKIEAKDYKVDAGRKHRKYKTNPVPKAATPMVVIEPYIPVSTPTAEPEMEEVTLEAWQYRPASIFGAAFFEDTPTEQPIYRDMYTEGERKILWPDGKGEPPPAPKVMRPKKHVKIDMDRDDDIDAPDWTRARPVKAAIKDYQNAANKISSEAEKAIREARRLRLTPEATQHRTAKRIKETMKHLRATGKI